jgi:hypothetical protein
MRQCQRLSYGLFLILGCAVQGIHGKTGGGGGKAVRIKSDCVSYVACYAYFFLFICFRRWIFPIGITPDEVPSPSPTTSSEPTVFEVVVSPPISGENACRTTDSGVFGEIDGEPLGVSFQYAVELAEGTSESEFTSLLLPDLEIAMNDAILPALFVECSGNTTTGTSRRRALPVRHRQLMETITGISVRPFDSIEADIECTGSNCHGLLGILTIFISSTQQRQRSLQEDALASAVRMALKDSMDAGAFNDMSDSILSVSWVDDGLDETPVEKPPPPSTDDEDTSRDQSSGNNQVIGWTVAVGAAALLVVLVAAISRRRRRNNMDDQSAIEGNSTLNSAI